MKTSTNESPKTTIVIKRNPYTKEWYIREEINTKEYMKLRYSTHEYANKSIAKDALKNGEVTFKEWEIF
jgi:hypothetical protein